MDFGLLPPEVNSGRMYTGPGPGPMLAAATAWDALAGELHSMAAGYEAAVTELDAGWQGPSAVAMASAAAPYTAWLHTAAAQAEQSAAQGRTAAAAYEAAFAATVPPPVIAANRSLLMTLVATNFLGQNTPAIAATEAHYAEMWAQDATAMYSYAAASATAAQLTPFTAPPPTANPADTASQSAAAGQATAGSATANVANQLSRLIATAPAALNNLTAAGAVPAAAATATESGSPLLWLTNVIATLTGPYSPLGYFGIVGGWWLAAGQLVGLAQNPPAVAAVLAGPKPITGALAPLSGHLISTPAGLGGGAVSGAMSRAGLVGSLSVPAAWAETAPVVKTAAALLPSSGAGTVPAAAAASPAGLYGGTAALASLAGRALDGAAARSAGAAGTRTIGTAATCVDPIVTEAGDNTVTILVIPPPEH